MKVKKLILYLVEVRSNKKNGLFIKKLAKLMRNKVRDD